MNVATLLRDHHGRAADRDHQHAAVGADRLVVDVDTDHCIGAQLGGGVLYVGVLGAHWLMLRNLDGGQRWVRLKNNMPVDAEIVL